MKNLGVEVDIILEIVLLAENRLADDRVIVHADGGRERRLIGHSQPRDLLSLLKVLVVHQRLGIDRHHFVAISEVQTKSAHIRVT